MNPRMTKNNASVLVASSDDALVIRFIKILGLNNTVTGAGTWPDVIESVTSTIHHVVILDPELAGSGALGAVEQLTSVSSDTHIIIVDTPPLPEKDQVDLFKLGVHGFCQREITSELLRKAVNAVVNGELWMQRTLITRIIDDLTRSGSPETTGNFLSGGSSIGCLTPRELEVARMVHKGGNNKSIARKLDISERTVKAHLSSIFRKLNIENRLHLALFFHQID
jgi:two-component system nitrate/nitrite response regulator NarL